MQDENIIDLYQRTDNRVINKFTNNIDSKVHVSLNVDRVNNNYEWLDIIEDTIVYIDNILRNPNRFIINEEDVVKIELARRITVDSIKHLSRNTNLIQDYDRKTGDVKPSKILNINKEESFNTYENRFIYSLIENMSLFISRKKQKLVSSNKNKCQKKVEYSAFSKVGKENVNFNFGIDSLIDTTNSITENGESIEDRINKVEMRIRDLKSSEVYKMINKLHITLVTSPIKKTNVILKNVNFQYAVKLWNYMQEHFSDETSIEDKEKKDYYDNDKLKQYYDESFLLDYLVLNTLDENKMEDFSVSKDEIKERLVGNIVEKIIDIDNQISEEQLSEIVAKQFVVIKNKYVTSENKIKELFHDAIDKYLSKISNLKFESILEEKNDKSIKEN